MGDAYFSIGTWDVGLFEVLIVMIVLTVCRISYIIHGSLCHHTVTSTSTRHHFFCFVYSSHVWYTVAPHPL
eukprot:m.82999 g.82999  ORF g.82999 m.82999 type:complete len:71 (+) comp9512_c1_seq2:240-452(+)